jgi:putative zinc finger protein
MDHNEAMQQMIVEKYLLDELSPESREEFEAHFFGCRECVEDLRAGAVLVQGIRSGLADRPAEKAAETPERIGGKSGWLAWLRPALVVPALAILLAVIGYQNLVTYPQLKTAANAPQVLPWASVSVSSRGANAPVITTHPGEGFLLFVNVPPDGRYSSYLAELRDPGGRVNWSLSIPASSDDSYPVHVPAAQRVDGTYTLAVQGVSGGGEKSDIGRAAFELRVQK